MACKILHWVSLIAFALVVQCAYADAPADQTQEAAAADQPYRGNIQKVVDGALDLIGIKYHRGGSSPLTGFDCSGLVDHVFRATLGMILPRSSRDMSKAGEPVPKTDLKPGDLVFFDTMRRAFSHVGIYLGDHMFVHAPRPGQAVSVADLRDRYWAKRYDGARRINSN